MQQAAVKECFALTESRINAANEIKDVDDLNAFVKDQFGLTQSGFQKIHADSKLLIEDTTAYHEEVIKLFQESGAVVTDELKKLQTN